MVERCVNRLEQWRAVATRYEKRTLSYRATVVIRLSYRTAKRALAFELQRTPDGKPVD